MLSFAVSSETLKKANRSNLVRMKGVCLHGRQKILSQSTKMMAQLCDAVKFQISDCRRDRFI